MRKKMETSERDQTSRASFKCLNCEKKFTDLEANQLLDFTTGEMRYDFVTRFWDALLARSQLYGILLYPSPYIYNEIISVRCTYCSATVDEDESSEPKKDSRLQLAKFNLEMKPLYELLHDVESIRLAIQLLEPEPVDISALLSGETKNWKPKIPGDATMGDKYDRGKWANAKDGGFGVGSTNVEISIGDENTETKKPAVSIYFN